MPTRFTEEQLAASATAGEPRAEESFGGDRDAWHTYQAEWFAIVTLGDVLPPVGDSNRAKRWKAARRQRGKIEAQREKAQNENTGDAAARKRLKVSDQWVAAHVPALRELQVPKHGCRHFDPRMPPFIVHARVVAPQPRRPTLSGAETAFPSRVGYLSKYFITNRGSITVTDIVENARTHNVLRLGLPPLTAQ